MDAITFMLLMMIMCVMSVLSSAGAVVVGLVPGTGPNYLDKVQAHRLKYLLDQVRGDWFVFKSQNLDENYEKRTDIEQEDYDKNLKSMMNLNTCANFLKAYDTTVNKIKLDEISTKRKRNGDKIWTVSGNMRKVDFINEHLEISGWEDDDDLIAMHQTCTDVVSGKN